MTNLPKFSVALLHPRYWCSLVGRAIALPGDLQTGLCNGTSGVAFYEAPRPHRLS